MKRKKEEKRFFLNLINIYNIIGCLCLYFRFFGYVDKGCGFFKDFELFLLLTLTFGL